ncbi:hypothetical protein BDY21DRAFT_60131 [Lineolata rhizophorae]|uniref:Uncharacterized protein n=1 Tax=Lineolata rhizophorae TaxID=578093 RepID=A0A6A6NVF1_9PEZI|nr:hypothetical protein BDY21DRAFT_60131 [Lineolata rhizophorae]
MQVHTCVPYYENSTDLLARVCFSARTSPTANSNSVGAWTSPGNHPRVLVSALPTRAAANDLLRTHELTTLPPSRFQSGAVDRNAKPHPTPRLFLRSNTCRGPVRQPQTCRVAPCMRLDCERHALSERAVSCARDGRTSRVGGFWDSAFCAQLCREK